jgi:hypothetical protein
MNPDGRGLFKTPRHTLLSGIPPLPARLGCRISKTLAPISFMIPINQRPDRNNPAGPLCVVSLVQTICFPSSC